MLNNTFTLNIFKPEITQTCFNWCKEQHYINQNNLTIYSLTIPLLALVSLFGCYLIYNYNSQILNLFKENELKEHHLEKAFKLLLEFSILLLLGFFIWFIFFK